MAFLHWNVLLPGEPCDGRLLPLDLTADARLFDSARNSGNMYRIAASEQSNRVSPRRRVQIAGRKRSEPIVTALNQVDLAHRYFVNDLPSAAVPATRLRNTLDKLQSDGRLSAPALNYLRQLGLSALQRHAQGEITYEAFCETAALEQTARVQVAEAEKLAKEAERKAREAVWAAEYERERQRTEEARRARESDPKYIAKLKSQQLRTRYGLDEFIEPPIYPRVMEILRRIDGGNRLTDDDVLWLKTDGKDYYSEFLEAAFHEREAEYFAVEYSRTSDPWNEHRTGKSGQRLGVV